MQKYIRYILFFTVCIIAACEKEIDLKVPNPKDAFVVEGHIENGVPPYVLLTRNAAFYGNLNLSNLASYFVSGASVTVISGNDTIPLQEYNGAIIQALPDSVAIALAAQFGLNISSASEFPPIVIYTVGPDNFDFVGELGKQYSLKIEVEGKTITSTTTIPQPVFFDSLWLLPHPNAALADSFYQVYGRLQDPPALGTFYRYFTKADNDAFLINSRSVFDDALINGGVIEIFIPKGRPIGSSAANIDFDTDGYWDIRDSVCTIKLSVIDKPHYDFWRTVEANRNGLGNPFGSAVFVKSNVNGAYGIWGGYGSITGSFVRVPL
ncbi:MAG TPA: DUF4249 family protein [Chitinophagales bacterium]|jgi:hypothetical protein|nr:DUF4249 family protein [Chitinophagales bacterium]